MGATDHVKRVCFQLQVRPDRLEEYRARHAAVWPEMLKEIEASGRRNYSLFLRSDGLLIGYFETSEDDQSATYLANSRVASEWEAEAASFFADISGRPDQSAVELTEIFNLEDQIAAIE